jgi:hypothetical protein
MSFHSAVARTSIRLPATDPPTCATGCRNIPLLCAVLIPKSRASASLGANRKVAIPRATRGGQRCDLRTVESQSTA